MSKRSGFLVPYDKDGNFDEDAFRMLCRLYYKGLQTKQKIERSEIINLSDAYSSLKDAYMYAKISIKTLRRKNNSLREELEDYKQRYDSLIKHLNSLDSEK